MIKISNDDNMQKGERNVALIIADCFRIFDFARGVSLHIEYRMKDENELRSVWFDFLRFSQL